jgi:hypothetical protein
MFVTDLHPVVFLQKSLLLIFLDYLDLKPIIAHSTLLVRNRLFSLAAPISLAREQSRRFSACSLGFVLRSNKII